VSENRTARDLMNASFLRLGTDAPLREAVALLLGPGAAPKGAQTLVVTDADGRLHGLLTPRSLVRSLVRECLPADEPTDGERPDDERPDGEPADAGTAAPSPDDGRLETDLLRALTVCREKPLGEVAETDVPRVAPDTRLLHLMELIGDQRRESVPVTEDDRVIGIVHLAEVFAAAAALALAPEARD
jgi:CBS domain-containing protein